MSPWALGLVSVWVSRLETVPEPTMVPASFRTIDISCTGVGLSGSELPGEGEVLEIKIDRFSTFGTVVWQTDTQCGVAFDPCLEEHEVEVLRSRAGKASLAAMSVVERIALEDWVLGVSR